MSLRRKGSRDSNLDTKGRPNKLNKTTKSSQRSFWKRKSSGGAGG
ncbi:MAG: hypothetical protein RR547_12955 [Raoultibacter sp.]